MAIGTYRRRSISFPLGDLYKCRPGTLQADLIPLTDLIIIIGAFKNEFMFSLFLG